MRSKAISLSFLALSAILAMSSLSARAADPAPGGPEKNAAATPRPPQHRTQTGPIISPQLLENGDVTFRLQAPRANEVKLAAQFGPEMRMSKDTDGVWSVTAHSVPPDIYEYHFVVDGLNVIDPRNAQVKPQRWPGSSILHVPATPPASWDLRDVPHGVLHEHTYKSKALKAWRHLVVYTPPGAQSDGPLPVLYLSHGYSDNELSWTVHGKAHWILDNLIAEKKALPMIVVMPDGHALPPESTGSANYMADNTAAYARELLQDVIPLIESNYKVVAKPQARAFAGLSMGGHHAMSIALNHHDTFGWIGALSSAPPKPQDVSAGLEDAKAVNHDLKLFWIACGKQDFLHDPNAKFMAMLKEKGIHFEYTETEGGHAWPVWRRNLTQLAPMLFREAGK